MKEEEEEEEREEGGGEWSRGTIQRERTMRRKAEYVMKRKKERKK